MLTVFKILKKLLKIILNSLFFQHIFVMCATAYMYVTYKTSKWNFLNKEIIDEYINNEKPLIICFWHGRLMMMPFFWQYNRPFYMLISQHRDGKLIGKVTSNFGIKTISGSTQRNGIQATLKLVRLLKTGLTIGITPDGPRGPNQTISQGIISLSKLAKADVIPVTFTCKHKIVLNTWDRFLLALPFNNGVFYAGKPIKFQQCMEKDNFKQLLEEEMARIHQITDDLVSKL